MKNQVKRLIITVITTCVVLTCTETSLLQISDDCYSIEEEMIHPNYQPSDGKEH